MSEQQSSRVSIGETLKKIRKNKNYTQKFVTDGIISQSTYSKIEAGAVDPSYTKFSQLLKRLDMTEEEFRLLHAPEIDEREQIIQSFFRLNYNDQADLNTVKKNIKSYLRDTNDVLVKDLGHICEAMLYIIKDRDYQKASRYALKVWKRLEKFDQWYLMEFRLINTILFIFPLDSVLIIAERIHVQLEAYNTRESRALMNNLQTNISLVLIRNKEYQLALEHINRLEQHLLTEHNYYLLAISYLRKGIALHNLNQHQADEYFQKAKEMIRIFGDPGFEEAAENEVEHYTARPD